MRWAVKTWWWTAALFQLHDCSLRHDCFVARQCVKLSIDLKIRPKQSLRTSAFHPGVLDGHQRLKRWGEYCIGLSSHIGRSIVHYSIFSECSWFKMITWRDSFIPREFTLLGSGIHPAKIPGWVERVLQNVKLVSCKFEVSASNLVYLRLA